MRLRSSWDRIPILSFLRRARQDRNPIPRLAWRSGGGVLPRVMTNQAADAVARDAFVYFLLFFLPALAIFLPFFLALAFCFAGFSWSPFFFPKMAA